FSGRGGNRRWVSDWSPDVCSSDLVARSSKKGMLRPSASRARAYAPARADHQVLRERPADLRVIGNGSGRPPLYTPPERAAIAPRSEERRVGKEGRCRWGADE